jgi:hypothetical protein
MSIRIASAGVARKEELIMNAWTVKNSRGELLTDFAGSSRLDVGRKVVPGRVDAFRLQVSASYRELFDRTLSQVLEQNGWQIVRVR